MSVSLDQISAWQASLLTGPDQSGEIDQLWIALSKLQGAATSLTTRVTTLETTVAALAVPAWVNDAGRGGAILTFGGVNSILGNGTVTSQYRVDRGQVHWYGHYFLGSTTSWGVGFMALVYPTACDTTTFAAGATMMSPGVRAYNGQYYSGYVEMGGTSGIVVGNDATPNGVWQVTGGGGGAPFIWGNGHILSWNFRYPAPH